MNFKDHSFLFEQDGYYVEQVKTKKGLVYQVCRPGLTHATVDSVYDDLSLAKARWKYLTRNLKNEQ